MESLRNATYLTKADAFLAGAALLTQVFMEAVGGTYSATDAKKREQIHRDLKFHLHADHWFEAWGLSPEGYYLVLEQSPCNGFWGMTLKCWASADEHEQDDYKDGQMIVATWGYKPQISASPDEVHVYWTMVEVKKRDEIFLFAGQPNQFVRKFLGILTRIYELAKDESELSYLPYQTLGWFDWSI